MKNIQTNIKITEVFLIVPHKNILQTSVKSRIEKAISFPAYRTEILGSQINLKL